MLLNVRFNLNTEYNLLIAVRAHGRTELVAGWSTFLDRLRARQPALYAELAGLPQRALFAGSSLTGRPPAPTLKSLLQDPLVRRLSGMAAAHREDVRREWEKNKEAIAEFFSLIGAELPALIDCFIVHPALRQGAALSNTQIVWGHHAEFPNYASVYIAHELLHCATNLDPDSVTHAIIELAADNELRCRLNRRGRYFEQPGHAELAPLERKLLPVWRSFLEDPKIRLMQLITEQAHRHDGSSDARTRQRAA